MASGTGDSTDGTTSVVAVLSVGSAEGTGAAAVLQSVRRALRLRSARERRLIRPSLRLLPTLRLLGAATGTVSESGTAVSTSSASLIVSFNASSLVRPDLKKQTKQNAIIKSYHFTISRTSLQ